jgi:hypothetical protein
VIIMPSTPSLSMASDRHFLILILCFCLCHLCSCFNFEPRLPVIKRGPLDSYFGFSVAQHLIADETRKKISEAL